MRRALVLSSAAFAVVLSASVTDAYAQPQALGHPVRWDLVQIVQGTVIPGGSDVGKDATSQDTITLTGSGDAEPARVEASGGGTFVHRHANNTEVAHGIYQVIAFMNWRPAGGAVPITDAVGEPAEASSGVLTLAVRLFPSTGGSVDGILTVNCDLPWATFPITEGITLAVGPFNFEQNGGGTLFHIKK